MHKGLEPQAGELDFTVTFKIRYVLPYSKTACWISCSDLENYLFLTAVIVLT